MLAKPVATIIKVLTTNTTFCVFIFLNVLYANRLHVKINGAVQAMLPGQLYNLHYGNSSDFYTNHSTTSTLELNKIFTNPFSAKLPPALQEKTALQPHLSTFNGQLEGLNLQISPDGQYLAYCLANAGSWSLFIVPCNDLANERKVITFEQNIHLYGWCYNTDYLWFTQDVAGNEDYHLFSLNHKNGQQLDLTPLDGIQAAIVQYSAQYPNQLLIQMNALNSQYYDLYKVDITTGLLELIQHNKQQFVRWIANSNLEVCLATKFNLAGDLEIYQKQNDDLWSLFDLIPFEDTRTTMPLHLSTNGETLYYMDSRRRNTAALTKIDLTTGQETILAQDSKADVGLIICNPQTGEPEAACFTYVYDNWIYLNNALLSQRLTLDKQFPGQLQILSRNYTDIVWLLAYTNDLGQTGYYLYWPATHKLKFVASYSESPELNRLAPMHSHIVTSRDGLELVCYYTLPNYTDFYHTGLPATPLPMVLVVHGGPWQRDYWGFDLLHQNLAAKGYAVLSVNFRGSSGFGKNFFNASIGQWAGKMHEDLLDAVNWAIEQKIALPDKIAIYGESFGGYAALIALTKSPTVFACGIDLSGPSNLVTLLQNAPPYWSSEAHWMRKLIGADEKTSSGLAFLRQNSPLTNAHLIVRPLLIGQGANDVRVRKSEADQIVAAIMQNNRPVSYALFEDEGHGIIKAKNRQTFFALLEQFLAKHLKEEVAAVDKDVFSNTSLVLLETT